VAGGRPRGAGRNLRKVKRSRLIVIDGTQITFDNMTWEDVPAVMAIEQRSFTLPWSANTYRHELLENANAHYYVLRRRTDSRRLPDGWLARLLGRRDPVVSIVGYGGFWFIADEAHISTIAVEPEWRGRGLGEFLLVSMIERAMGLQAAQVTLEVREGNLVAQNLYRKYGFKITGKRPRYYQDNQENAFLMTVDGVNTETYRRLFDRLSADLSTKLSRSTDFAKVSIRPSQG
jgi:ribosomal-protein-alanine N-acetyltransferase